MSKNRSYIKIRISVGTADLIEELLFYLSAGVLFAAAFINTIPVEGRYLPVLNHHLVASVATGIVAFKFVLKFERNLPGRFFTGFPVFPKSLLFQRIQEMWIPNGSSLRDDNVMNSFREPLHSPRFCSAIAMQ